METFPPPFSLGKGTLHIPWMDSLDGFLTWCKFPDVVAIQHSLGLGAVDGVKLIACILPG